MALAIALTVASTLDYVHRAVGSDGRPEMIVHRDVTPDNILLSYEGQVLLSDFGNAVSRRVRPREGPGVVSGTLGYVSPEQARGQEVTFASDLFALGCVLHRCVIGASPVAALSLVEVAAGLPPVIAPEVPADLASIIRRATQGSAKARYRSAAELAEECARALSDRRVLPGPSLIRRWLAGQIPAGMPVHEVTRSMRGRTAVVAGGTSSAFTVELPDEVARPLPLELDSTEETDSDERSLASTPVALVSPMAPAALLDTVTAPAPGPEVRPKRLPLVLAALALALAMAAVVVLLLRR